jgi:RimJ/RimL family protein N-acetyltransferase
VAVRAVDVLMRWCFDELGLVRVRLEHSTLNQQSCRVATKAGFPLEGTQRASMRHADGWHDAHLHARTQLAGRGAVDGRV